MCQSLSNRLALCAVLSLSLLAPPCVAIQRFRRGVELDASDSFWVRAELVTMAWRRNCITTTLCAEPRVVVAQSRQSVDERINADWRIDRTFALEEPLISYGFWRGGATLADISLQVSVTGVDSIFHFMRLCDETPHVRIASRVLKSTLDDDISDKDSETSITTVELRANCFNATLYVRTFYAGDARGLPGKSSAVAIDDNNNNNAVISTESSRLSALLAIPTRVMTADVLITIFTALTIFNLLTLFVTLYYCTKYTAFNSRSIRELSRRSATASTSTFLPYDVATNTTGDKVEKTSYNSSDIHYDTINEFTVHNSFLHFPDPEPTGEERIFSSRQCAPTLTTSQKRHSHTDFRRTRIPYSVPQKVSDAPAVPQRATRSLISVGRVRLPAAQCCNDCFLRGTISGQLNAGARGVGAPSTPPLTTRSCTRRCSCEFSPSIASNTSLDSPNPDDSGRESIA